MRIFIFLLLANSAVGHPAHRIRYSDPVMQKEYEEHCRNHKGYKIPPDAKPPPILEGNKLNSTRETSSDRELQISRSKKESINKRESNSNTETISDRRPINSQVTRTSSSSSSSLPLRRLSLEFSLTGWLWSESAGWVYISHETYPYYYSHQDKKWLNLVLFK